MEQASGEQSVLVQAGLHLCALPLGAVIETLRPLPLRPLAGAPAGVLGVAVVRGSPVPVIDLAWSVHRKFTSADSSSTVTKRLVGWAASSTSETTCCSVMPRALVCSGICFSTSGVMT